MSYVIFSDSTCNLPNHVVDEIGVRILSLKYYVNEEEFLGYKKEAEFDYNEYYAKLRNKEVITTSLINADEFVSAFEEALNNGEDVLYLAFSSGLSGTYQASAIAADMLKEKYPDRKIVVVDTLSASIGEGLLVIKAAGLRDEGKTIEEVKEWIVNNSLRMAHLFTVDDLMYLKRGGRLSGTVAAIGTLLQVKPTLRLDDCGHLVMSGRVNGRKKSLNFLADEFGKRYSNQDNVGVAICHGDCFDDAKYLADRISEKYGAENVLINYLDVVCGAHAGPGTIGLFFMSKDGR